MYNITEILQALAATVVMSREEVGTLSIHKGHISTHCAAFFQLSTDKAPLLKFPIGISLCITGYLW